MAARLNPRHSEMIRDKIRAAQLVKVLEDHVLGDRELGATQITAAIALLKKCVPDLSAQQISGDPENPLLGGLKVELVAADSKDPAAG